MKKSNSDSGRKVKAYAKLGDDNKSIAIFGNMFGAYCIYPSREQVEALERAYPTGKDIVEVSVHILPAKGKKHEK